MEFGCRYIYVDQSSDSAELSSHLKPVKAIESQIGAVENDPAFYDHVSSEEGPKTEARVHELPQKSVANRLSPGPPNLYHVQSVASTNLDQSIPPPIPDRKKKPLLCGRPGVVLPQGLIHSRIFPESKAHQDLSLACSTNLEQQQMRPPIPDRKKKPSVLRQSSATATPVYNDGTYEELPQFNLEPCGATATPVYNDGTYEGLPKFNLEPGEILQDDPLYMDFPPAELSGLEQSVPHCRVNPAVSQAPDVLKGHPVVTMLPIEHDYVEVIPSQPTELEMQSVPPSLPNRPITPSLDVLKGHPVVTMLPVEHDYVEVIPSQPTELEMQSIPPSLPDRPITPSFASSADRLPANCNILLLNIGRMVDITDSQTLGSPLLCIRCSAAFSELNNVQENKTWTCVFCATENPMTEGHRSESTEGGDQLYIRDSQPGNEYIATDDTMLVFCIDISGSMSVTTEVTEDQSHECQRVYTSRMEAMKSGLSQTLNFLYNQHPKRRVALVTFSDQVKIYGDGTIQPQVLEDSELLDPDYLKLQGENQPVPHTLEETLHVLGARIEGLQESGVTALGPAALVSIAMAAKRPGSKVIICTDGKANTDLGNLESIAEEYTYQSSRLYYSNLADVALQHSVVVSVVTIEGTDCRLPELGQLADKTGGKVNIVHPLKLASEFQSILEEEINATDVKLKVFLPHSMHFLYEGHAEPVLERTFGSTTLDTVLSTEFDIHSDKIKEVLRFSQLPIQVHLSFTLPDGRGRCRIISQKRPVTNDGTAALESINLIVLQNHSVQFSARLAMEGHVNEARKVALELKELVDQVMRHEKYDQGVVYEDWECTMAPVYEDLQVYEQNKSSKGNGEQSYTDVPVVKTFSDEMAKMIFHMKRAKSRVLHKLKYQAEQ